MKRGQCTPEQRAACPRIRSGRPCYTDKHHMAYPKNAYQTPLEQEFRGDPINQMNIPRCLHDAIHASGYVPKKPSEETMIEVVDCRGVPAVAVAEQHKQLRLGEAVLAAAQEAAREGAA